MTSTASLRAQDYWVPRIDLTVLDREGQSHDFGLTVETALDRLDDSDADYVTVSFTGTPAHACTALARLLGETA